MSDFLYRSRTGSLGGRAPMTDDDYEGPDLHPHMPQFRNSEGEFLAGFSPTGEVVGRLTPGSPREHATNEAPSTETQEVTQMLAGSFLATADDDGIAVALGETSPPNQREYQDRDTGETFLTVGPIGEITYGKASIGYTASLREWQDSAGEVLVSISPTGEITYGANYDPDEAARVFWSAVGDHKALQAEVKMFRYDLADAQRNEQRADGRMNVMKQALIKQTTALRVELAAARLALLMLQEWDMLSLGPDGHGVATADAPWAQAIIATALATGLSVPGKPMTTTPFAEMSYNGRLVPINSAGMREVVDEASALRAERGGLLLLALEMARELVLFCDEPNHNQQVALLIEALAAHEENKHV